MKEIMVFLVLAIVSYLLRRLFIWIDKDSFIDERETTGTITRIIDDEGGTIMYYVSFVDEDGIYMEGQSIHYSSTKGKYKINDTVSIKYSINKKGRAQVSLLDDELVSCAESVKTASRNMLIASIVFLIIAAIFFVKNILL
ncbi:hypothetical protein E5347_16580 [Clostridium sartagoforme]|uniref:DUF3592 domain-containing protein n=1 Tax=Clostridium sartagoforme TaxID=84031 RepID=A0A4S2DE69_9CLOT|nr:hypothetical protein [Clostridium sartagoforme]TGY38964.1 hypothetical protein E5347_16580 [Clostridium sartagoforme]